MRIFTHQRFGKHFKKLRQGEQQRFRERRDLFLKNPFDALLDNHPLHGEYRGCRSISIGGNLRAVYRMMDADTAYFIAIGTHSELYGS